MYIKSSHIPGSYVATIIPSTCRSSMQPHNVRRTCRVIYLLIYIPDNDYIALELLHFRSRDTLHHVVIAAFTEINGSFADYNFYIVAHVGVL